MQRMAANMGGGNMPYMPPGAAEQMKNMKPEDFARASEELGQMDPETLKSQMNNFKNQNQAPRDYALRGAEQLKTDGNKLVGEGKYNEAIEKYMRVKNNLADDPSAGAKTLRQSCQLNMSLCFNKTKRYNSAISECTEVLKQDGKALKAYYRRGQAHAAKEDWQSAVADLRRAVKLAPGDETVKGELDKAVVDLQSAGLTDETNGTCPEFEITAAAPTGMPAPSGPIPDGDQMAKAMEMMKDPDAMAKAAEMMENMSEEQLEAMGSMGGANGMPKVDPKMAKQAAAMMKNMDPDAMKGMMDMAAKMKAQGMDPAAMASNPNNPEMMAKMAEQMKNPEMQNMVSDMMKNISPEQLKEMGAAAGMKMSDEQAKQTAEMMQNISPETMQRMMKVGSALNGVFGRFRSTYQWCSRNKLMAGSVFALGLATFVSYVMRWGYFSRAIGVDPVADEVEDDDIFSQ
jgi:tetratricopeptide (TPR) repeat protein